MGTALTVPELKTAVMQQYPRATAGSSRHFDTNLERWIYELCDFPFWFLSQRPSPDFFSNFPISDYSTIPRKFQQWCDIGWLITEPGQSTYIIGAPMEDEQALTANWWGLSRASQLEFVKVFNDNGTVRHDCKVCTENWLYSHFEPNTTAPPHYAVLQTRETYSRIILHPTPDKAYPIMVQYSLRECPLYTSLTDGVARSRFLNFAASAVQYKCLYHMADFFDEQGHMDKFSIHLLGAPFKKGDITSQSAIGGIIGKLKQETYDKAAQLTDSVAWYPSIGAAVGRGSNYRRYRPPNGGYWL